MTKLLPPGEKEEHEILCDYRSIKCFDIACNNQSFVYCNIGAHFKSHHNVKHFDFDEKRFFQVKLNNDNENSSFGILYERTFRKCFLWKYIFDKEDDVLLIKI